MRENYICRLQRFFRDACMVIRTRTLNACVSFRRMPSVLLRWVPSLNDRSKLKGQYTDVKSGCVKSVGPSLTPHSLSLIQKSRATVPLSTGNWSFRKSNQTVWLRAVWHHFGFSHISISRLRAVTDWAESRFSRISSRKRIFQRNYFRLFIKDPDGLDSWKKIAKNLVTLPL